MTIILASDWSVSPHLLLVRSASLLDQVDPLTKCCDLGLEPLDSLSAGLHMSIRDTIHVNRSLRVTPGHSGSRDVVSEERTESY